MTDFVAVIRRAVDGLKDNNPEMRAKVYEKARSAVLKQLENMKPRPTDEVIARQMAKLDSAVISVENEHADALPALYEPPITPSPVKVEEPRWQDKPVPSPVSVTSVAPPPPPPPIIQPQPNITPPVRDANIWQPREPEYAAQPTPAPVWQQPVPATAVPQTQSDMLWMPDDEEDDDTGLPPAPVAQPDFNRVGIPATAKAPLMPEAIADIPWDVSPFEEDQVKPVAPKVPPRAAESPRLPPAPDQKDDWDEFNEFSKFEAPLATSGKNGSRNGGGKASDVEKIVSRLEGKSFKAQPKTPNINYAGIIAGLAGLVIVGVGGYGIWHYRTSIMSLVNGTTAPATVQNASTKPTDGSTKPAPATTPDKPKQTQVATANTKDGTTGSKFTQRLLPDGSETNESLNNAPKPDGKEGKSVAEQTVKSKDVAATNAPAASVAGTSAPATTTPVAPLIADNGAAPGATPAAPADATAAPSAQATDTTATPEPNAVAGGGQKMLLYEERLGQASPTAINGTVSWSVENDTTATTGKPQSEIQAKINVPERGLSALITFKRNTDKSLPASHVVELVFSLPKDFDGGGIDSVQRIAMKQTEQDRGNSLIAVPAKITDDFHMIALNDDPAAVASNTDLMKNRSWIDIPITYRNGRRALITIEKGPDGTDDFNKVMAEWAALSPA